MYSQNMRTVLMSLPIRFKKLRIRTKLLVSYSVVFMLIISLVGITMYSVLRRTVEANIESELKNTTESLLNMVKTAASVSIKNHLRAVAEKNLEMVNYFYRLYKHGVISEAQARRYAAGLLLSQRIGTTGYIACVSSNAVLKVHPKKELINTDINKYGFSEEMTRRKQGYLEYDWQNPDEPYSRPKAMYMAYFEPWDWIITVSSYRNEFHALVNVDDFRESVLSRRFGKTGYSFVTDTSGTIIIHPKLQGVNIFEDKELPDDPLRTMLKQKHGKIVYFWRNPDESISRKKMVIFNYIPEYEWIVASSSYLEEFYSPIRTINNVILFTLMASFLLILPITFLISGSITNPLRGLILRMKQGFPGQLPEQAPGESMDEINQLQFYFNTFMDRLDQYRMNLQTEISERKQAEEALKISEERYRSVMEASPDPIIVYDMQGKVLYFNPAFTDVFGWTLDECINKKLDYFVPEANWKETRAGIKMLSAGHPISSVETRRRTKNGDLIEVSIRGAVYRDRNGNLIGSVTSHRDVTEIKRLEKKLLDIGDRERQLIGLDLHDDLGPHLIGIEGLAKVLKKKLDTAAPEESKLAEKIAGLIRIATGKTRQLARGLCPVYLVDHGLESSLRELALNTESIFRKPCEFHCKTPVLLSDHIVSTHVFRIAQEAVNNAVRHSKAKQIQIFLAGNGNKLNLTVCDDGCGISEDLLANGMGLRIMGFRAKMINGLLEIRNLEKGGTEVHLTLNP
ncbi:MAG: PAS domain S-box protein [Desulfobacteraceae bacterium]|nr:PAS domain S-box protein [Desulfobacteraceae bacterium]